MMLSIASGAFTVSDSNHSSRRSCALPRTIFPKASSSSQRRSRPVEFGQGRRRLEQRDPERPSEAVQVLEEVEYDIGVPLRCLAEFLQESATVSPRDEAPAAVDGLHHRRDPGA